MNDSAQTELSELKLSLIYYAKAEIITWPTAERGKRGRSGDIWVKRLVEFARQSRLNVIYIGIKRDSQALQEQCEQACGSEGGREGGNEGGKVAWPNIVAAAEAAAASLAVRSFLPSTDHVIELFSSQKGRHPPLSLSLSPSLSLACTCFVSVCFLFARQSACRKLPTCQVASSASQLDAASFIHSLTVSAFPLSVHLSVGPSVCSSALAWLASFCVFLSEKLSGCRCRWRRWLLAAVLYLRIARAWHTIFIYYSFSCKIVP